MATQGWIKVANRNLCIKMQVLPNSSLSFAKPKMEVARVVREKMDNDLQRREPLKVNPVVGKDVSPRAPCLLEQGGRRCQRD